MERKSKYSESYKRNKHSGIWMVSVWADDNRLVRGQIQMTVLSINFIGDGLRDAVDPRSDK